MNISSFNFILKTIRKDIQSKKVDAFLFSSNQDRFWITNFDATQGYVIVTPTKQILLIDNRYFNAAKKQIKNIEIILFKDSKELKELFLKLNIKNIAVSKEYTSLEEYDFLYKIIKKIKTFSSYQIRSVKTEYEIIQLQKSADLAVKGISWLKKHIKLGMSEIQARNLLLSFFYDNGASSSSFDPIIAFGVNSAIPHHKPTNKKLLKNEAIKCDIGCKINGYCSDITRTFWIKNVDPKILEIYKIVLTAQELGIKAAKVGVTGKEIDQICRDYITEKGYGDFFIHGTGHGLGIDIHELPNVKSFNDIPFVENNVITIEPGIYLPNIGGVRIEDSIVIKKNKPLILTKKACK